MGYLIFSAIFAISFAWMWNRNDKANKRLRRLRITDEDEAVFDEWRIHTQKRMSRANWAAGLLTLMPLMPLIGVVGGSSGAFLAVIPFNICAWGALILAFMANASGRKSDLLAEQLSLKKGVDWLASNKSVKKSGQLLATPEVRATIPIIAELPTFAEPQSDAQNAPVDVATANYIKFERDLKAAERKEGMRNLILAALGILLIKTLISPSTHVLLPDVADSGPRKGCVIGFRYVKKTWWGFRKQTYGNIRFAAEKRPQYYDPDGNKWLNLPSEAYADAEDDEVNPYEPVEYFR
jgi:hypothetical protein